MEFNSLVEREDLGYSKYKSIQYVKKGWAGSRVLVGKEL